MVWNGEERVLSRTDRSHHTVFMVPKLCREGIRPPRSLWPQVVNGSRQGTTCCVVSPLASSFTPGIRFPGICAT